MNTRAPQFTYGPNDPNATDAIAPEFDPYDGDLLHDLVGKHIGPALEDLFIRLKLHEMTPDFPKSAAYLADSIKGLREACRKEFEEQL